MSHLEPHIRDEKKGAREYSHLARKERGNRGVFKAMARDESRHAKQLQKIERKEAKSEALKGKLK